MVCLNFAKNAKPKMIGLHFSKALAKYGLCLCSQTFQSHLFPSYLRRRVPGYVGIRPRDGGAASPSNRLLAPDNGMVTVP